MDGIQDVSAAREPSVRIPPDWTGLRIALRFTGGVGDVLVAIGGTAPVLKRKPCAVVAAIMSHQIPLIRELAGVDEVVPTTDLNNPVAYRAFDVVLNFAGTFNTTRTLKAKDYYTLVSDRVGFPVSPGQFKFPRIPRTADGREIVAMHPGASNPNRQWPADCWKRLASELVRRDFRVVFLGTRDEPGYAAEPDVLKLSDESEDLLWQVRQLAGCHRFVGNDSGFAHAAGVLGVPGVVIFSVTHPDDVIARYDSLRGVHAFEALGIEPTRSLRIDDPVSKRAIEAVEVDDVLEAMEINTVSRGHVQAPAKSAKKRRLLFTEDCDLASALREFFDVAVADKDTRWDDFDLVLCPHSHAGIRADTHRKPPLLHVNRGVHIETVRRAAREILNREES